MVGLSRRNCGPGPANKSRTEAELLEEILRSYLVLAPRRSERLGELC
jgi:hypothetical protein